MSGNKVGRGALNRISGLLPAIWIEFGADYLAFGSSFGGSPQELTTPPSLTSTFVYPIYLRHRHLTNRYSNEMRSQSQVDGVLSPKMTDVRGRGLLAGSSQPGRVGPGHARTGRIGSRLATRLASATRLMSQSYSTRPLGSWPM